MTATIAMAAQAARKVVVTGGSGGIGEVVVRRFLAAGDCVVNLDREPFAGPERDDARLVTIPVDLADGDAIAAAFAAVDPSFEARPLEVLVCCAALSRANSFLDVTAAELDLLLAVNVRGAFLCGQEAGRRMKANGKGHIVVVTSIAASQAWARESVYCLTKAAQASLVQTMAIELAPFGVLVNAVAPGIIDVRSKGMAGTRAGEVYRHEMERFPLGRFGAPEEIAQAIQFLSIATWTTGQTLTVDGGFMSTGLGYFGEAKQQLLEEDKRPSSSG